MQNFPHIHAFSREHVRDHIDDIPDLLPDDAREHCVHQRSQQREKIQSRRFSHRVPYAEETVPYGGFHGVAPLYFKHNK